MKKIFIVLSALSLFPFYSLSQDMDSLLNSITSEGTTVTTATFKSTRIINGHSIERMQKKQLDVRIHHRFGMLNAGAYELYGLDQSNIFLGAEYGITDKIMIGIGRSTYQKTVDGFTKISLLRQSTGEKKIPVSLSVYLGCDANGLKWEDPTRTNYFSSRLSYIFQVLIAKKINERFSFQVSPTMIHKNMVQTVLDNNDSYALGLGGRIKLTKRISFNGEYFFAIHPNINGATYNPNSLSVGFDIETGGHVFQIILTNSQNMSERTFINETTGHWKHNDIRIGFNISRVFSFN